MTTLRKIVVLLALAVCLAVPAANAHPDRGNYRNDRDRYYDFRDDRRGDSHVFSRDTRRALTKYEWERRKRFAEAARRSERERADREREIEKRLREARRDHRRYDDRYYRSNDSRYRRISHGDDVTWSIVLDVAGIF